MTIGRHLVYIDARNAAGPAVISTSMLRRVLLRRRNGHGAACPSDGLPLPPSRYTNFEESCIAGSGLHLMALARALKHVGAVDRIERWCFLQSTSPRAWQPWVSRMRDGSSERWWVCDCDGWSPALSAYLRVPGNQPAALLVAGTVEYGKMLEPILRACGLAFKISYPVSWEPWTRRDVKDRLFDLYLVDEPSAIDELKRRAPHICVLEYTKQVDYVRTFVPRPEDKEYDFVVTGAVCQAKGQDVVIRAASLIQQRYGRSLRCCFVGAERFEPGWEAGLKHMARDEGVDVTFTGQVDPATVNTLLNKSRVGVVPSWWEVAPRALLEYMAADLPVVVNARLKSGLKYVHSGAGLVAEPEEMAHAMWHVLNNRSSFHPRDILIREFGATSLEGCARTIAGRMLNR
jgi:glycosyltransferase involved in cell wall biosynthesis